MGVNAPQSRVVRAEDYGRRSPSVLTFPLKGWFPPKHMKPRLFPMWLTLLATSVGTGFAQLPHFDNVTVTVIGDAGQNMETLNRYKDDFTQAGITIKQVGATFTGLYDKLKTSFVAGS